VQWTRFSWSKVSSTSLVFILKPKICAYIITSQVPTDLILSDSLLFALFSFFPLSFFLAAKFKWKTFVQCEPFFLAQPRSLSLSLSLSATCSFSLHSNFVLMFSEVQLASNANDDSTNTVSLRKDGSAALFRVEMRASLPCREAVRVWEKRRERNQSKRLFSLYFPL